MNANLKYGTVSEAVNSLKQKGYTLDFNLEENCIVCHPSRFRANEFEIMETWRYEGNSDPGDEATVYGIESKNGLKGILVMGYGMSSDKLSEDIIKKLRFH
jgi:hypothetical protein